MRANFDKLPPGLSPPQTKLWWVFTSWEERGRGQGCRLTFRLRRLKKGLEEIMTDWLLIMIIITILLPVSPPAPGVANIYSLQWAGDFFWSIKIQEFATSLWHFCISQKILVLICVWGARSVRCMDCVNFACFVFWHLTNARSSSPGLSCVHLIIETLCASVNRLNIRKHRYHLVDCSQLLSMS